MVESFGFRTGYEMFSTGKQGGYVAEKAEGDRAGFFLLVMRQRNWVIPKCLRICSILWIVTNLLWKLFMMAMSLIA
ncbi:MAG: hypothetical protein Ct9H300mP29_8970 [Candidatus Neomarinimicrobiota bacterium]|nr:MAG: hypothetical protein Ct9H300mP29_8970 [Candidatus Neomarinimicrobiota bacterium]